MSLDVAVDSPLVLLPTVAGGGDGFSADLGRFGVRNTLERRKASDSVPGPSSLALEAEALLDCIAVTIEQMQLSERGGALVAPEGEAAASGGDALALPEARLLSDMAFSISIERGVGRSASRPLVVAARGGELACRCSSELHGLLMRVATQNLTGGGDVHTDRPSIDLPSVPDPAHPAATPRKKAAPQHLWRAVPSDERGFQWQDERG